MGRDPKSRFKVKKSQTRCETPTFVSEVVAEAVIAATEEMKAAKNMPTKVGVIDDNNSLIEREPEERAATKDEQTSKKNEQKSDFREWLEKTKKSEVKVEPTRRRSAQEILGNMWLDFVETRVLPSVFCRAACGDFDDETTAASSLADERNPDAGLAAYALVSTPKQLSPRKERKRVSSRKPRSAR